MLKVNLGQASFRSLFAVAFAGVLLLGAPFATQAQQPIVIKFSHVTTSDTPKGCDFHGQRTDECAAWPSSRA